MPSSTVQLHKAMIHMCLAIEKLADALDASTGDTAQANVLHARELVNDAHRQMCEDPWQPHTVVEELECEP